MSVFARLVHLPYIRYIKTDIERTGALASTWVREVINIEKLYP